MQTAIMILVVLLGTLAVLVVASAIYQAVENVAGPPALSAPWTPRASQREADAHPPNRRRHTERGLRIRHGRVLPELDAGASGSGAVYSRGKVRPRRTRLERSGARAAHGTADRAGATHAAGCHRCARAIRSRWALVRRVCEPGVC